MFTYFIKAYTKNYFNFSGRASRKEFWGFNLYYWFFLLIISMVPAIIFDIKTDNEAYLLLIGAFFLPSIIPSIAISVRRLHDRNLRGWWLLFLIIPIVNYIASFVFLIFYCLDSTPDNRFGPNPKSSH